MLFLILAWGVFFGKNVSNKCLFTLHCVPLNSEPLCWGTAPSPSEHGAAYIVLHLTVPPLTINANWRPEKSCSGFKLVQLTAEPVSSSY